LKGKLETSAVLFSLTETARENGLNPFKYLTYIFTHAPNMYIRNDIDALRQLLPRFVLKMLSAYALPLI